MIKNNFLKTFNFKLFLILLILYIANLILFNYLPEYFLLHHNKEISDIIISNIPSIDLSILLTFGYFVPQILLLIYLLLKKNFKTFFYIYFITGMVSLTRLFFNMMTHLQAPSDTVQSKYFPNFFLDNDLFFSGHVAIPFLIFLIYKKIKNKKLYILMLVWTLLMGLTVLFMKVHYTIDVFSAPFITFGVFYVSDKYLKRRLNINIYHEFQK